MTTKLPPKIRSLARRGVFRARDLAPAGIPRYQLRQWVDSGLLMKTGRGLYMTPEADITEHHSLVQLAARSPQAVVCLLSALRFHGLTTENPEVIYVLLPKGVRPPRLSVPELDVTWASGAGYTHGIQEHRISGVTVRVSSPAKTVADCFKHRSKVGVTVAAEALRDVWKKKQATADELWRAAKACRMMNVMRPYFEMMLT
ncbi:MAG: type IV toxin-antitoxin system AbiEi family antitoxin domain-containing protein [Verrucomicrobiota bacterium]